MVYSDDIRLRYIYGFYFSSKKLSYIPQKYLKYNVRKGMVGRSEDVPRTFECLVGTSITCLQNSISMCLILVIFLSENGTNDLNQVIKKHAA